MPIAYQFSMSAFFRFTIALQFFFAWNYLTYTRSLQASFGSYYAGWPFKFSTVWQGSLSSHSLDILYLALDVYIALFFSCLFAFLSISRVRRLIHLLRTWGTPWAEP